MAKKSDKPNLAQLVRELEGSHREWEKIYREGCSDPFWPDGTNLNLVRNHILYYNEQIRELEKNSLMPLPEICRKPVPPEVDNEYMAKEREIREKAKDLYRELSERFDIAGLVNFARSLTEKECNKNQAKLFVCRRASDFIWLGKSIDEDRLVDMRRFVSSSKRYPDEFAEAFVKIDEIVNGTAKDMNEEEPADMDYEDVSCEGMEIAENGESPLDEKFAVEKKKEEDSPRQMSLF